MKQYFHIPYSLYIYIYIYIYILVSSEAKSFSNSIRKFMRVRLMGSISPSIAMSHILFSYLLLFFLCYHMSNCSKPVSGAEEARDGFHSTPISALLPKKKCSVPAGGEAPFNSLNIVFDFPEITNEKKTMIFLHLFSYVVLYFI